MSVIVMKMPKQQQQQAADNVSLNPAAPMTSRLRANRCRSFHFRYLDLCRSKNTAPIGEIRKNNKDQATLDFCGDKLSYTDWHLITNAINCDQMLRNLSLHLRKSHGSIDQQIDSEKKARSYRLKPVIYAKIVFTNVIDAISHCIEANKNLTVLHLEGLPLSDYIETIVKALSTNKSVKDVSFARSNVYDSGCGSICNTFKYLENIEKLNLSDTGLTTKGAEHIANMIKIQKISRYTEGWQQSLRYKEVDANAIAGLRAIFLARNPQIGDEGLDLIVEVLKEDVWVKVIDMENCGLTDRAANLLIDCLKVNDYITEFNVNGNPGISKFLLRKIGALLRKDIAETDGRTGEELLRDFSEGRANSAELAKNTKLSMQLLIEQFKKTNEQLQLERRLRLKAEELNEKLTAQVRSYEFKLNNATMNQEPRIPEGYVAVKNDSLQALIKERNNLHQIVLARSGASHQLQQPLQQQHRHRNKHEVIYDEEETSPRESEIVKNLNYLIQQGENGIQFLTPLPEPTASSQVSARSRDITAAHQLIAQHVHQLPNQQQLQQQQQQQPPTSQIRKVKSEMKYMEAPLRNQYVAKKKDTKSDYDYATESDVPRFESNIGDTVANMAMHNSQQQQLQQQHQQQFTTNTQSNMSTSVKSRSVRYGSNVQLIKKYEMDEISLPTTRSRNSVASSTESDTMRCSEDFHISADFRSILQQHTTPMKEHGQGEGGGAAGATAAASVGGGVSSSVSSSTKAATMPAAKRSPRSLFLGLCEQ